MLTKGLWDRDTFPKRIESLRVLLRNTQDRVELSVQKSGRNSMMTGWRILRKQNNVKREPSWKYFTHSLVAHVGACTKLMIKLVHKIINYWQLATLICITSAALAIICVYIFEVYLRNKNLYICVNYVISRLRIKLLTINTITNFYYVIKFD